LATVVCDRVLRGLSHPRHAPEGLVTGVESGTPPCEWRIIVQNALAAKPVRPGAKLPGDAGGGQQYKEDAEAGAHQVAAQRHGM